MTLSRQQIMVSGLAAAALTAVALAVANFLSTENENGGGIAYAVTLGGSIAVALLVFGWLIPRTGRPGRAGLVTGLTGVLSLAAFWTGLPYVLGPAAVVLGLLGRARAGERGQATVAVVLGVLVTAAGIAAVVVDQAL